MAFKRDIFLSGRYIKYFNPDDRSNPFFKIYNSKKRDTIEIINESAGTKRILDAGGGMGRLSLSLAKQAGNKIVLTDISIDMLKLVLEHACSLNNIKLVNADAHRLPFYDESFDYIICLDLFCHLEKPKTALYEFYRVLTNQGILIMDSTNSNPLWALFYPGYLGKNPLNWLKILKFRGVGPGWEGIVRHYSKKNFFVMLRQIGFNVIRNIDYGPFICPKWHLAVARKVI